MEPIELSLKEQIELFACAANGMNMDSPLWQKGADLCLEYDIERRADSVLRHSETLRYLRKTIDSREAHDLGLNIEALEKTLDIAVEHHVFSEHTKTFVLAEVVKSDALLYRDDLNELLSRDDVRTYIRNEYGAATPDRRESDKRLKRANDRLIKYEHDKILLNGRDISDVKLKKYLKELLGGKMADAVFEGIAPHKGISKKMNADLLELARKKAKDSAKSDKLADRQEQLEQGGFVRKVINRKKQRI